MSAYVSMRQHTSALEARAAGLAPVNGSIRQHMSAYVSIRQHTSAYISIRQHTSALKAKAPLHLNIYIYIYIYIHTYIHIYILYDMLLTYIDKLRESRPKKK
jgi:hypothetical protein